MKKKPTKKSTVRRRAPSSRESIAALKKTIALQAQQIREGAEQQAATSDILRMIARTSGDLQSVMDAIAENAARLCDANDALVWRVDKNGRQLVSHFGASPTVDRLGEWQPVERGTSTGRAIIDRKTIHVHDLLAVRAEFPAAESRGIAIGVRSTVATPLLRDQVLVGVIHIRRMEVRPFTAAQIKLLEIFADQAVIAIENARLFNELENRNRQLTESLEQQTATGEVLRVIASSPTELQPVLDTLIANAVKLSGATKGHIRQVDGEFYRVVAHYGETPERIRFLRDNPLPATADSPTNRAFVARKPIHITDVQLEPEPLASFVRQTGVRTLLATPLIREETPIGVIIIWREVVEPFTERQIELVKTFADQAVIAIENVRLFEELQARNAQLTESLEQQTATSEILRAIASSPTDIQPVLNTVAESAARLCEASDALIHRVDGDIVQRVAVYGTMPVPETQRRPLSRGSPAGRAIIDRQTIHVHDVAAELAEFPDYKTRQPITGVRTTLCTPLLRESVAIGVLTIRRKEVQPFTEKQIALLKTFADQAVIAIENVRLFNEIQERNTELREALEHQTATSEVLGIISRSPTDVQPVLDAIVESAARVCGIDDVVLRLRETNTMTPKSHFGSLPLGRVEISVDEPQYRWMFEHGPLHIPDIRAQNDFPAVGSAGSYHTHLSAPLRQQGELIGTLTARRTQVRPFTPAQIKLLETFADQAVIAIENVRLFNELKESLEQQTASSEILGVIASSPTDIQPVLDVIAENAARVCSAEDVAMRLVDRNALRRVAHKGAIPATLAPEISIDRGSIAGRAVVDRQLIHIPDLMAVVATEFPEMQDSAGREGIRTVLAAPLLRKGAPIGVINIRRTEVRPFTEKQIKLLETFADQAVIAIENVRLFKEIQERNAQLREALEHQTATSEVLGIISRSPTDVQPVLDAIVESAARVCGIDDVVLRLIENGSLVPRAHFGSIPLGRIEIPSADAPWLSWIREHGALHIADVRAQNDFPMLGSRSGWCTFLSAPLRQQGELIGTLNARRSEVRPFTPAQIKLLETFADQAVIAIENVRLFRELKESLEQQTATSEILGVIASSPTDVQPVLDVVARNAARLCDATDAIIIRRVDDAVRLVAQYGPIPSPSGHPLTRGIPGGRAILDGQTIHVHDMLAEIDGEFQEARDLRQLASTRTVLAAPLLREGISIGAVVIRRQDVRLFTEKQIKLLETFADQAVIAIENVRLFKELEERNRQITEALEQQTATSEILRVIASSPTDIQPVLDTVAENAARLCEATDAVITRVDGENLKQVAQFGAIPIPEPNRINRHSPVAAP